MDRLARPDGAEIHWESRGEGRLVLITRHIWSEPQLYTELIADLARDHNVVTYDPRGCGESSEGGPYDLETDARDLLAVAEAGGGEAITIAIGAGFNRAARIATAHPDAIAVVVAIAPAAAAVLPRAELERTDVMAGSQSVMEMLLKLLDTDPRAALHAILAATNPELDESAVRKRVDDVSEYLSLEATAHRIRAWLADDVSSDARALGDRLWILHGGDEPLYEGALAARAQELLPRAQILQVGAGPVSDPEMTAGVIRRIAGTGALST